MQESKAKYKACLEASPDDYSKCDHLKKLFEVD